MLSGTYVCHIEKNQCGKCVSDKVSKEKNLVSGFLCKQMSLHSKDSTSGNSLEDVYVFMRRVCVCVHARANTQNAVEGCMLQTEHWSSQLRGIRIVKKTLVFSLYSEKCLYIS